MAVAVTPDGLRSRLAEQSLPAKLLERPIGLLQRLDPHAAQYPRFLRVLNLAVVDDLDLVAPRVAEAQALPG